MSQPRKQHKRRNLDGADVEVRADRDRGRMASRDATSAICTRNRDSLIYESYHGTSL
jgi:hypothetical protein